MRRIFERLIWSRFNEQKAAENWDEGAFRKLRMTEKVTFLKGHLPSFLVANAKIYSILSIGIHQLDEDACLTYFETIRKSIQIILEDDRRAKEEKEQRDAFTKVIASFVPPGEPTEMDE